MQEESKNISKKTSLTKKQKVLLAISVLLFLILSVQICEDENGNLVGMGVPVKECQNNIPTVL